MLDLPTENPFLTKYLLSIKYFSFDSMFANNFIIPTEQKSSAMALVEKMIDIPAPLDKPDVNGQTLLMWASEHGQVDIVALLLEQGANPELTDQQGETALIKAARNAKCDVVKLLLKWKVDTEKVDALGNTALAIVLNDYTQFSKRIPEGPAYLDGAKLDNQVIGEIIKLLLKHRANPEVMLNTGTQQSTLWTAIVRSHSIDTDGWWINSLKSKKPDYPFDDEFAFACKHDFVHGVRTLLKIKPEILQRHKNCVSLAVKARYTLLLGVLLKHASPQLKQELLNHRDEKGDTPLLIAFREGGNARMAAHLLSNGDNLAKLDSPEGIKLCILRSKSKEWKKVIEGYAEKLEKPTKTPELVCLASQAVHRYAEAMQKSLNEFSLPVELQELCESAPKQVFFLKRNMQSQEARAFIQKLNGVNEKDKDKDILTTKKRRL